jgi:hypothetical protein
MPNGYESIIKQPKFEVGMAGEIVDVWDAGDVYEYEVRIFDYPTPEKEFWFVRPEFRVIE